MEGSLSQLIFRYGGHLFPTAGKKVKRNIMTNTDPSQQLLNTYIKLLPAAPSSKISFFHNVIKIRLSHTYWVFNYVCARIKYTYRSSIEKRCFGLFLELIKDDKSVIGMWDLRNFYHVRSAHYGNSPQEPIFTIKEKYNTFLL